MTKSVDFRRSINATVFAMALVGFLSTLPASLALAGEGPQFAWQSCDIPGLPPPALQRMRCGTVEVPRIYDNPEAGTFKLAVALIRSARQPAPPDPVVILTGGPGGAAIEIVGPAAADPAFPVALLRDVILIDQRGTGRSEPKLCGSHDFFAIIGPDRSLDAVIAEQARSMRACLEQARNAGIAPESFGTAVAVEDVERVRRALGLQQWNILGASYDTVTGMALAAKYPQGLRALVLDSVLVLGQQPYPSLDEKYARARDAFLAECAASAACARKYPRLGEELAQALRRLDAAPLVVPLPATAGVPGNRVIINRSDFEFMVFTALYGRISTLPAMIRAANEGRGDELTDGLMGTQGQGRGISVLPFLGVSCRDDGARSFHPGRGAPAAGYYILDTSALCRGWTSAVAAPPVAAGTRVPTLVLGGSLDPITPPANGRVAAQLLGPAATFVEIPSTGHTVAPQSPCAGAILEAFLAEPSLKPDTSCVQKVPRVEFK